MGKKVNYFIDHWKRQTFAGQLTIVFMGVFLFQLLIVEGIGGGYLKRFMEERIEESYQTALRQTALSTESSLQVYREGIDELFRDSDFILAVEALDHIGEEEEWRVKSELESIMKEFMAYRSEVRSMSVRTTEGNIYSYDRQKVELLNPETARLHSAYFSMDAFEDNSGLKGKWMPAVYYDTNGTKKNYVFSYGKQIMEWYTAKQIGTGVVSIDESILQNICRNAQVGTDRGINFVMMTDGDGKIISHYDREKIGEAAEPYTLEQREKGYLILEEEVSATGWKLVSFLKKDYVYERLNEVQRLILFISLLLAVIVLFIIYGVSKRMSRYITDIVNTMNKVQSGKMSAKVGIHSGEKNEISQIAMHFNVMMNTVNEQMQTIRESGERQKEAELRALEAQINPHFIYNTLDSINWLAIENDQPEISAMLSRFGQILRYQIQKSNKIVAVEEELVYLEQYLYLQKARFLDSFEYAIDCQESVKQCRIYKMIFQPFIENAVIHGLAELTQGGLIKITVREQDAGHLCFCVEDNGKGMTSEQIQEVFIHRANRGNSIGVPNVLARLELYYGADYTIRVKAGRRGGTVIETVIPKQCREKTGGRT